MARKSRKETVVLPVPEMDTSCRTGIYVRLSVEDKHTHTASIETQQLIIARYLEQNPEIVVVQTYIDNGATGANFHRPGFQQMLSDIEAGLINCVIVKDLSRLGRNVIDTGYYIERYFPMQKVRFIAVNDRYDSSSPDNAHDGIIIPLRNMINEAYAMDIARKIKAQQRQAMKDGKYVGARTPYGYLKAPDNCHQLIVDPVAAEVVKTMFQWAAEGAGLNTIAVRLNEAGYLSPSHYKRTLGEITHENLVGNGHWQTRTVSKILRAEVYTGDLVQGVSKIIDHKQVKASADEWTTVRGTHEAIISRELFAAVQKALDQAAQQAKDREIHSWSPNLLRGKIFCAHCGHSLHRQKCVRRKSQEVYVYHCISNNRIKKGVCPGAFIFEKELLDKITIRNFRIFDEIGITAFFKKGVNAIISENNCGKTAIIDAMRIAFSTVPYKKDIYFNLSDFHVRNDGVRCNEAFISVYFDEISPDFFEIWDPENPSKGEFHIRYYTIKTPEGKEKIRYNIWGGPVEGNPVSADIFEAIQLVFLGALRDAETEMRPSRSSKLASLFSTATNTDEAKEEIINVLRMANSEILKKDSLIRVGHIVNDNLSTIEQDVLKQSIELGLVEPRFEAIAGALRAWIKPRWVYLRKDHSEFQLLKDSYSEEEWTQNTSEDETGVYLDILALRQLKKDLPAAVVMLLDTLSLNFFELFQNGLGYNNILFMSTVLGDMKTSADTALFNLLLVEEPEAHLHPQLQELVHGFFDKNSNRESFQVIYTSHSPTLVSRIGIDKLVLLYEQKHRVNCLSLSQSNIDEDDRDNLERYLDVTKSQMLFAKGILFVEGISEALLLPIFAEYLNRPLDKYAVEVINVDGVSFKPFANLLCYANDTHQVTIKATIITDDDRCTNKEDKETYIVKDIDYDTDDIDSIVAKLKSTTPSERFQSIDALCQTAHVNIFGARKTFEYELAAYPENIPYLLEAIIQAQPVAGKRLASVLAKLHTDEEKAACLWLYIRDRSKYKGEIAQNLARRLKRELTTMLWPRPEISDICAITKPFIVPDYIKKAVYSVTEEA